MGNTRSADKQEEDVWWNSDNKSRVVCLGEAPLRSRDVKPVRSAREDLDEFKLDLARRHERRRQIIAEKRKEMEELREEVRRLKEENEALKTCKNNGDIFRLAEEIEMLKKENEELKENRRLPDLEDIKQRNLELKMTIANLQNDLQELNTEVLNFEKERQDYKAHVVALKDVISVSKQMLMIREAQLKELKQKVKEIEESLAGKEIKVLSQDLRAEYEKQLQNIRNLRAFYEERQRADKKEKDEMRKLLDEVKKELQKEQDKNGELGDNLQRLEEENSKKYDEIMNLESSLGLTKAECRQYQAELSVINQLFSQILLGFKNNQEIEIDKLIKLLEENHHLLQDIAINEESNQVSVLPKVLLDLVNEVNDSKKAEERDEVPKVNTETQISHQLNSASEIVENLPKVWKVLIELLSHQSAPVSNDDNKDQNSCYKLVETPKGPNLVLSVSKTFIRLKDLIIEKKSLERETGRLKHLNTHLECRLQEQEKRLELVTSELAETWHVVGKLQKKHQLLHTQEKILRYELAQKRKLLAELKVELECSREKWQEAREKNSTTEKQWKELRIEFASRKNGGGDDSHNSVESGYSDDKECSSEDEPGYETDVSEGRKHEDQEEILQEEQFLTLENQDDEVASTSSNSERVTKDENEGKLEDVLSSALKDVLTRLDSAETEETAKENKLEDVLSSALKDVMVRLDSEEQEVPKKKSLDDILAARDERFKRLEGQCSSLVQQVTSTSNKSVAIEKKLDELHEMYGEGEDDSGETSGLGDSTDDGRSDSTNC